MSRIVRRDLDYDDDNKMAGRPRAPMRISNNVIAANMLSAVDCVPRDMYNAMVNDFNWLTWLADHRLIRNTNDCVNCRRPMSLVRRVESPEGYSWRCRACNSRCSVRRGSFFALCVLRTDKIMMMMYYWLFEVKAKHVMLFESVDNWSTMVNYNNFFRMECRNWFQQGVVDLGGLDVNGVPVIVEVDESYFFHRKYHRGRYRRGQWIVGVVERVTGRCWLELVAHRDAQTLERIISAHVLPGSIIMTDAWRGYANVSLIRNGIYQHEVIVHQQHFVDNIHPEIHTQTIEGMWMQAKRKLRYQGGTNRGLLPSYLAEFQWRFCHKLHPFGQYLSLLCDNYRI